MGYDRGASFPLHFEPNGIPFDPKSKGKLTPRSYPIQFERKWKHGFLSVHKTSYIIIRLRNKFIEKLQINNNHLLSNEASEGKLTQITITAIHTLYYMR